MFTHSTQNIHTNNTQNARTKNTKISTLVKKLDKIEKEISELERKLEKKKLQYDIVKDEIKMLLA